MTLQTITIKDYLTKKGIQFREIGKELVAHCLFDECDKNSKENEAHLYFDSETGQYECKKCGEKGNIVTLAKHLGDTIQDIALNPHNPLKATKFDDELVKDCHQAMPERIRQYLKARGLTDAVIDDHKLGWGKFYDKCWITIPIPDINGDFKFFKLRQDPNVGNDKMTYPKGIEAELYGYDTLNDDMGFVVISEGELDRLALLSIAMPAVTSTHGAMTFKPEWAEKLAKVGKVYLCFDNDEAGRNGSLRVAEMLKDIVSELFIIALPPEAGEGGDVTDFLIKLKGNPDDLLYKYAKKYTEKTNRIKQIEKPNREVSIEEWQEIIKNNFPELLFPAEIGLSIISQILIKEITNPFALVLVDVPSSGKTITINFFSEISELTYASDKFTPASFLSNASNVKKEDLPKIDLLPRLRYKMFLIRDLATIFAKRDDDLTDCLGTLTRALDGEGLNSDSGIHGQRFYVGEYLFMILAGSTPIPPRVWKMMGNLGSRLFFLNMGVKEKTEEELAEQLTTVAYKEKEKACRMATRGYLYTLWHKHPEGVDWDKTADKQEYKIIIVRCAQLLAKLRGVINVWKDKSEDGEVYDYTQPVIEKPDRINQLFYNLCRGHALVCGRTQINQDDLRLIIELAIDSAPTIRAQLFRKLLENDGQMMTNEAMKALNCSRTTALKQMESLKILGLGYLVPDDSEKIGEEKTLYLVDKFSWFLSDECKKIRGIPITDKELDQDTMSDLV